MKRSHALLTQQMSKCRTSDGDLDLDHLFELVAHAYSDYDNSLQKMADELENTRTTLRKEHRNAIAAMKKRFEQAVQSSNDGIGDWDINADMMWFSPRFKDMLGYSGDAFPYCKIHDWYQLICEEDRDKAKKFIQEHLTNANPMSTTLRFCHRNNNVLHLRCHASVIRDSKNQPTRLVGVYTDITDNAEDRTVTRSFKASHG